MSVKTGCQMNMWIVVRLQVYSGDITGLIIVSVRHKDKYVAMKISAYIILKLKNAVLLNT